MSLREFTFGIGDTFQKVCLPEEHISDVMEGKSVPAVDIKTATIDCMRNPIGSEPLQKKSNARRFGLSCRRGLYPHLEPIK